MKNKLFFFCLLFFIPLLFLFFSAYVNSQEDQASAKIEVYEAEGFFAKMFNLLFNRGEIDYLAYDQLKYVSHESVQELDFPDNKFGAFEVHSIFGVYGDEIFLRLDMSKSLLGMYVIGRTFFSGNINGSLGSLGAVYDSCGPDGKCVQAIIRDNIVYASSPVLGSLSFDVNTFPDEAGKNVFSPDWNEASRTFLKTKRLLGLNAPCYKEEVGESSREICFHPKYKIPLYSKENDLTILLTRLEIKEIPKETFTEDLDLIDQLVKENEADSKDSSEEPGSFDNPP